MPTYIGSIPFPISALISGLLNAALVWAAGRWTSSARVAALPLWTWLLTVLLMGVPGPGGDVIFGGRGVLAYSPLLLLAMGIVPPLVVLSTPLVKFVPVSLRRVNVVPATLNFTLPEKASANSLPTTGSAKSAMSVQVPGCGLMV